MRYVLTGASGGGKSTLLAALARIGVASEPEIGRQIVRDTLAGRGGALPWDDPVAFRDLAFWRSVAAFDRHAAALGPVLFDRSFVEAAAHVEQAPLSPAMVAARDARRFAHPVLVCAPWPEIYVQDRERPKDLATAQEEWRREHAAYLAQGYPTLEVPQVSVAERVAFVLRVLHLG